MKITIRRGGASAPAIGSTLYLRRVAATQYQNLVDPAGPLEVVGVLPGVVLVGGRPEVRSLFPAGVPIAQQLTTELAPADQVRAERAADESFQDKLAAWGG